MTLDTLLIRPRLTDYHGITLAQEDADFAIPFFDEDIPLSKAVQVWLPHVEQSSKRAGPMKLRAKHPKISPGLGLLSRL